MIVPIISKRFFRCTTDGCEGDFSIDHVLTEKNLGAKFKWFCDECGCYMHFVVDQDAQTIDVIDRQIDGKPITVTLELETKDGHRLLFRVYDWAHKYNVGPDGESTLVHDKRYYYEQHTCPTNWFRDVAEIVEISADGFEDRDPHGFARFVDIEPGWHCKKDEDC